MKSWTEYIGDALMKPIKRQSIEKYAKNGYW